MRPWEGGGGPWRGGRGLLPRLFSFVQSDSLCCGRGVESGSAYPARPRPPPLSGSFYIDGMSEEIFADGLTLGTHMVHNGQRVNKYYNQVRVHLRRICMRSHTNCGRGRGHHLTPGGCVL